ncbi:MAG: fasciclin domain-containing protein [Bacteroidetes bacterium]|nr:fasciclin domain-containing protein [Bacteroidota bacterium]
MKIKFSPGIISLFTAAFIMMVAFNACNKSTASTGPAPGTTSVSSILKNASDATIFATAMARVHLDTVFNGAGPFTVFVPTDAAFAASGVTFATINNLSDDSLRKFLLYHTVAANLLSSNLPAGPNAKIVTAGGDSIFVTNVSNSIYVNGVPLLAADVLANNGVIHALQRALIPPRGNIVKTLQSDTSFSFLSAAITRASQGTTDITSLLTNNAPYTIFAPINNAFRSAGFATTDDINNANADSIANIVLYHILPARIFSTDMTSGQAAKTLNDSSVLFGLSTNVRQIKGNQNSAPANTLAINVMATNGVVFVIDQLLEP